MRPLPTLHVKGEPAVLPDRAIRRQSHYFIYRLSVSKLESWYTVSPRLAEGVWPSQLDQINSDPKGNWYWLAWKKID